MLTVITLVLFYAAVVAAVGVVIAHEHEPIRGLIVSLAATALLVAVTCWVWR